MHGPYSARILDRNGSIAGSLSESDVAEGEMISARFYQDLGARVLEGFTRAATFTTATLISAGEEFEVEIVGFSGSGRKEVETVAKRIHVRRDERGRLVSDLGVRFGERVFVGV